MYLYMYYNLNKIPVTIGYELTGESHNSTQPRAVKCVYLWKTKALKMRTLECASSYRASAMTDLD